MRMKIVGLLVVLLALCIAVDARNPLPENSVVVLTCAGFSDVSEMVEILRTNSFEPILVDDNRLPPIIEDDHLMVKNLVIHGITHLENRPKNFPNLLLQFLIKGGNIIWALGDFNTKSIFYKDLGEFLSQVGLKIHSGNLVAQESLERGLFASTLRIPEILGKDMIEKPFMFKSPGFIVSQESKKREFDLTYPLATLPRNSGFSVCTNKGVRTDVIPGLDAHLVTLFQSRTDSRMSIFSHKELLENSFLSLKDRSNRLVFEKLVNWSFKRTNTLEVDRMDIFYSGDVYSNHTHTCSGSKCSECRNDKNQIFIGKYEVVKDAENNIKKVFRVRDKVQIRLKIDESFYDSMSGRFVKIPFRKKEYIDISLNMLDPQRSIRLMRNPDTSQFWNYLSEDVNLPDRVGIYKLCLSLFHKGFTFIEHERLFVVRHFHYDEYERLLLRSLPYYITVLNMSIGFFVLLFVLLYVGEKQIKKK